MPKIIFNDEQKEYIINEYTIKKRTAKDVGKEIGCSNTTLLKNLKEWGIPVNSRTLDLKDQTFGKLTVIKKVDSKDKYSRWLCRCECGNTTIVRTDYLTSGHTLSCGCLKHQPARNAIDLVGRQFGEWTVLKRSSKESYWTCRCSCGTERDVYGPSLTKGLSSSCGCSIRGVIRKPILNQVFGSLTVLKQFQSPENNKWYCKCRCECGNEITVLRGNLTSGNTTSCGCVQSVGEANIKRVLQQNNIPYIAQWNPKDIVNHQYKFDFFINNEYVVEFDGPQHQGQIGGYYTEEKIKELMKRDQIKNKYCLDNNIPLYRIPYRYRDKITIELLADERFRVKEVSADVEYTSEGT